ncbi:MAG: FtsX-like permease family protein [bacterium]|nr:FtsX-like permease family protein [bacterium]
MFKNYLKTAYRNLMRRKGYTAIIIAGLAIAMASCLLIVHYASYEKSFDNFHKNSDNIYRMRIQRTAKDGKNVQFSSCAPPASPLVKDRYPEVLHAARICPQKAVVSFGEKKFEEKNMFYAESEFFKIFSFKFIEGNEHSLDQIHTAVMTQSTAKKYFGSQSPVGKTIQLNKKTDYLITGVLEDVPSNSHFSFDILLSFPSVVAIRGEEFMTQSWGYTLFYTYLQLDPKADPKAFEAKLPALIDKEFGEALKKWEMIMELKIQPVKSIHLNSHFMQELGANGDKDTVNFLLITALLIMLVAWVNYINLSTARSLNRAKEVGIRKTIGATRRQLSAQFFFETLMLNLISIALAGLLAELALPYLTPLTGTPDHYSIWPWFLLMMPFFLLVGVFISGFYPVMVLTSFSPVLMLKGKLGLSSSKGIGLRKALILFQFAISLFLIAGTVTVYKQLVFLKSGDLGINIQQVMAINSPKVVEKKTYNEKFNTFKNEAKKYPGVEKVAYCTEVPGRQIIWDNGGIKRKGAGDTAGKNYQIVGIDYDFVDLFETEIILGRNFSRDFPADEKSSVILSETAVRWMGFESPSQALNQEIDYWGNIYKIVGIMKDYRQQSLKKDLEPHLFRVVKYKSWGGVHAVKINTANVEDTIQKLKVLWESFFPGNPFEYFFLDEYYDHQYRAERLVGRVFGVFSMLALLLTCLGILGLSAFYAAQRTKEIGIRKTLGAKVSNIFVLLSKDFFILILLAQVIATPLAFFAISKWLEGFANRVPVSIFIFLAPLPIVILLTLLTISYQTMKAARINPVDSLRYE